MDLLCTPPKPAGHPLAEYIEAFDELERRAARGQLTLAQLRREVHALRERFTGGQAVAPSLPFGRGH
ncbi:hypothetical protein [Azohydromonas aeria]|uniref:hypothetical protein n=1 Tax=Azohydromonas aeria TaxID=2590212 RepID=UPI0012F8F3CB|nr:hypothetical protein [Azohydromonas aeria]